MANKPFKAWRCPPQCRMHRARPASKAFRFRLSNGWACRPNGASRVKPGEHGLRIGDLNVGIYGEVPEVWEDQTRRPRGALPRPGVPPLPYNLRNKHQMWADSAADLYEEAIQRRWIPATDVPWDTLKPLPEDVERAVCQVCTELSQYANTEIEIITYWQDQMSYGYYEVKQFLATATFDCARIIEALRKRHVVERRRSRRRKPRTRQPDDPRKPRRLDRIGRVPVSDARHVHDAGAARPAERRAQRRRTHDLRQGDRRLRAASDVRLRSPEILGLAPRRPGRHPADAARASAK